MTLTLYPKLREEIAEALVNRNRDDLAQRLDELDDDAVRDAEALMVDHVEALLDAGKAVGE